MNLENNAIVIWGPSPEFISAFSLYGSASSVAVKDYITGEPVPVGGVPGWDGQYLQASPVCFTPLTMNFISFFRDDMYMTNAVACPNLSTVVFGALFTEAATLKIYQILYDIDNYPTMGKSITIQSTNIPNGDYFYGGGDSFSTLGASAIAFVVEAPSTGMASFNFGIV